MIMPLESISVKNLNLHIIYCGKIYNVVLRLKQLSNCALLMLNQRNLFTYQYDSYNQDNNESDVQIQSY